MTLCTESWVLTVLILSATAFYTGARISPSEEAALSEILNNHPDLTSVPSWASIDSQGNFYGSSWNDSFSGLCLKDGYDFYGVYCVNGHIEGLNMCVEFSSMFPTISKPLV